jgi:hypothetical protein
MLDRAFLPSCWAALVLVKTLLVSGLMESCTCYHMQVSGVQQAFFPSASPGEDEETIYQRGAEVLLRSNWRVILSRNGSPRALPTCARPELDNVVWLKINDDDVGTSLLWDSILVLRRLKVMKIRYGRLESADFLLKVCSLLAVL